MGVELQDVLREHGQEWLDRYGPGPEQRKAYKAILECRTAALGAHVDVCEECGHVEISYNSCRSRYCNKCQATRRETWVEERVAEMPDVGYFHLVFTVPSELNGLFWRNQKVCYNLLMQQAWATVREICADGKWLGALPGAISVPRTWGRQLQFHPHVHILVSAGGLSPDGESWVPCKNKGFLAPVRAMSEMFRAKLVAGIRAERDGLDLGGCAEALAEEGALDALLDSLFEKGWVVWCKEPFRDASHVIRYLGAYTHRVAIANSRILALEDGRVTFAYVDTRDGRRKTMTIDAVEFIRRFFMHVLPPRFTKVRHLGAFAGRGRRERMALLRRLTSTPEPEPVDVAAIIRRLIGREPGVCPKCGGRMVAEPRRLGVSMLC